MAQSLGHSFPPAGISYSLLSVHWNEPPLQVGTYSTTRGEKIVQCYQIGEAEAEMEDIFKKALEAIDLQLRRL